MLGRSLLRQALALLLLLALTYGGIVLIAPFARPAVRSSVEQAAAQHAIVLAYASENGPDGAFRWLYPTSRIYLDGFAGQTALLTLEINSLRPADVPAPALRLQDTHATLAAFQAPATWRRYNVVVPTKPVGSTAIDLLADGFTPNGERRQLGVAIRQFSVQPAAEQFGVPLERLLALLLMPLLAWLTAWQLGARSLAILAGGAGGATAWLAAWQPALFDYYLPPIGWPWLPALALATLVAAPPLLRSVRRIERRHAPFAALLGSIVLALLGLALARNGAALLGGLVFAAGTLLSMASLAASRPRQSAALSWRSEATLLVGITLLAAVLRFYQLESTPFGLWRDEAKHAVQALEIWRNPNYRPVYVVENADLPALLFYLMAPMLGLFGTDVWSIRLVSALCGALMPLGLCWATRPIIGAQAALIGAALLAWASWALAMSRWAFPITLDQGLLLLALGAGWRALALETPRKQRLLLALVAGASAGLATYGYHTGRVAPLIVAAVALAQLRFTDASAKRAALPLAIGLAALGIVVAPLAAFIASDFAGYMRRIALVSVFNTSDTILHTPLERALASFGRYLAMWHIQGDQNARHHAPGAPMVDPTSGVLFALGLGLVFARQQQRRFALLAWLALALVPGVFSANGPHGLRSFGVLAPTCALAGLALTQVAARLANRHAATLLIWLALAASASFNGWLYFGQMAYDPQVHGQYDGVETVMAKAIQRAAAPTYAGVQVFVPTAFVESDEVSLFADQQPVRSFSSTTASEPIGPEALLLVWPVDSQTEAEALQLLGANGRCIEPPPTAPGSSQPLLLACGRGETALQLAKELPTLLR